MNNQNKLDGMTVTKATIGGKDAAIKFEDGNLVIVFTEQFRKQNMRLELTPQEVIDVVAQLRTYAVRFAEAKAIGMLSTSAALRIEREQT